MNKPYISRRDAREIVFCMIFEMEYHRDLKPIDVYDLALESRDIVDDDYIQKVFFTTFENVSDIDELINISSVGWKNERISKVTMSILRLAVCEMKYIDEISVGVAINEAVELCKKYDDDASAAFVNGILGAIEKREKLSR